MATAATIPAIDPPKAPAKCSLIPPLSPITLPTPFGVELKSLVDPSKGPPSNCALVHSLMLQLTPMLAGFSCILKILAVVGALEKFAKDPLNGSGDLLTALGKMSDCLGLINPAPWLGLIKGILNMILGYIECLIEGFESIRNFKLGIGLGADGGTPIALNTIECANTNADTSLAALMSSMEAIQPLMDILQLIMGVIGMSLTLPSLSANSSSDDPLQPIIQFHDTLQELVNTLPG